MTNKTEEIRKACIKANDEIVELKFGCVVEVKNELPDKAIYISEASGNCGQIHFNPSTTYFLKHEIEGSIEVSKIGKIIGRPLHLEDIMLAVKELAYKDVKGFKIRWTPFGEVKTWKDDCPEILKRWNLKKSFENQSEETKSFIHGLLYEK